MAEVREMRRGRRWRALAGGCAAAVVLGAASLALAAAVAAPPSEDATASAGQAQDTVHFYFGPDGEDPHADSAHHATSEPGVVLVRAAEGVPDGEMCAALADVAFVEGVEEAGSGYWRVTLSEGVDENAAMYALLSLDEVGMSKLEAAYDFGAR